MTISEPNPDVGPIGEGPAEFVEPGEYEDDDEHEKDDELDPDGATVSIAARRS